MRRQKTLTLVALSVTVLILMSFLTPRVVFPDPIGNPNDRVIIEGAHIVSEGAYFRFFVKNNYSQPIYVALDDNEKVYISAYNSTDFDVVAPQVFFPCENIVYTFKIHLAYLTDPDYVSDKLEYTVLVVSTIFVQIYNFILPFLIITLGIVIIAYCLLVRRTRARRIKARAL